MKQYDKEKKKNILYIGDVGQVGTALTVHAQNRARLFNSIGYNVSFVCDGGDNNISPNKYEEFSYTYTKKYIKIPKIRGIEWIVEEIWGPKLFHIVKKQIEIKKPDLIILYGYSIENKLIKLCNSKKIPLIVERVDWFEKEDRKGFIFKYLIQRKVDLAITKNDLKADGIIAISEYLFQHYKNNDQLVTWIPPIFSFRNKNIVRNNNNIIRLVYAGSLGGNKDQIIPIIEAMEIINAKQIRIHLDIVGITLNQLKLALKDNNLKLRGIKAYGRLSNDKTKEIIECADFSILLRQNKRYAKAGFSTKFAESMSLGVPVICTKVGGSDKVITDMKDGVHLLDNNIDTIKDKLNELLQMSNDDIFEMKNNAYKTACKLFLIDNYIDQIKEFIDTILENVNNKKSKKDI